MRDESIFVRFIKEAYIDHHKATMSSSSLCLFICCDGTFETLWKMLTFNSFYVGECGMRPCKLSLLDSAPIGGTRLDLLDLCDTLPPLGVDFVSSSFTT